MTGAIAHGGSKGVGEAVAGSPRARRRPGAPHGRVGRRRLARRGPVSGRRSAHPPPMSMSGRWLASFSPACPSSTRGEVFWLKLPAAGGGVVAYWAMRRRTRPASRSNRQRHEAEDVRRAGDALGVRRSGARHDTCVPDIPVPDTPRSRDSGAPGPLLPGFNGFFGRACMPIDRSM